MSRQLDVAIAEALGNIVKAEDGGYYGNSIEAYHEGIPAYSTDGNAMLELDREMRERGYNRKSDMLSSLHFCLYYKEKVVDIAEDAETEPLTRALAAYKALTGKEWAEHD